ncbi:hypothetical protein [Streptomyces pinistramenti]|uniref:hypothetical protein n=1 Tax=Streptomyces pinistramenti TaxID=2884812 RepID=UPI001D05CCB3|nr:hypothetical protein [Streptomyces pinistramenti]MCB5909069.1 hypothetical protein [Streptomyces pinistramenti]
MPLLFQQYVASSHGRDLRVVIVDGEPVAAAVRTSRDGALASNVTRGGSAGLCAGRYPEAEALAVLAARALGLTIAGADLLSPPPAPTPSARSTRSRAGARR